MGIGAFCNISIDLHEGCGAQRLSNYLAAQGIRRKDGRRITMGMILCMLRNPICTGIIRRGESESAVQPDLRIIDDALFARAQEITAQRTTPHSDVPLTTRGQSLLVGSAYCGCCGAKLILVTAGRRYQKKDGTVTHRTYANYRCNNRILATGKCDGQSNYSVEKLDDLVEQIVRIQLNQIKAAPPQALLDKQQSREQDLARAKLKRLQDLQRQKQRDYQDLRNEVLKVIQGTSRLNADLLNSLIEETGAELKDLASQIQTAETELQETISNAERTRKEYTQLKNWAALYDNCTFEAKKMIVSQFVKAVRVHRGYELDIEFNVTFEEFQSLYLEPETPEQEHTTTKSVLCLA